MFFVQINHTGKGFLFLIFREIKLRKYSSLHKLFYGLKYTFGRYHNHPLLAEMIIITTPYSPKEFYKNTKIANRKIDSFTQLQRRIFEIHITKDFILKENKYQRNSKEGSSD